MSLVLRRQSISITFIFMFSPNRKVWRTT